MRENGKQYLQHLDNIFETEPRFFEFSDKGEFPPFYSLTYRDKPDQGMVTGITLGVSFVEPRNGGNVRPELMVSVDSEDDLWVLALADIGYQHRGKIGFRPGDTINFNAKISDESAMTSFLVWNQGVIPEDLELVCLPDWHIEIVQLFPIHDNERRSINEHGPEWLFERVADPQDVTRPSVA
ncbi:MAG: hypothetical protein ACI8W7_003433 [Gammaproteobacteria bacterium]|jgi:hypothetical protein